MSNLTPAEVIRLGIEQGQPADVIAASLEAAAPREDFASRAQAELERLYQEAQAMHFDQLARFLRIALAEVKIIGLRTDIGPDQSHTFHPPA